MQDIMDQISRIIQDRALKQSEIARRACMTPSQLCLVLKHYRKIDANEFIKICSVI